MSEVVVRAAVAGDADALTTSIRAAYAVYAGKIADLPLVEEGVAEDITAQSVWVAEIDGIVAGGAVLVLEPERATLANIATHPDFGGRGVARALIARVEDAAREAGAEALHLATHVEMPGNVALYEKLGWREMGREGNKVLMAKPL